MNVAIVGSRTVTDMEFLNTVMKEIPEPSMIVSGGALGADSLAQNYAKANGLPIKIIYPNWNLHGKGAGFKRNVAIVDESDLTLVLWDGISKGAAHDVNLCISKRKPCKVFAYGLPTEPSTKEDVHGFKENNSWLSNGWPCNIKVGGLTFPSAENVYQAAKFYKNKEIVKKFSQITPVEAKVLSKKLYDTNREDYDPDFKNKREGVMERAIVRKFTQNEYLKRKLILTGDFKLENTNSYGDTFWGCGNQGGQNKLGEILTNLREKLSTEQ